MSRLHNARKRLRSALGPMLLVLVYLAVALGAAAWTPAGAQALGQAPAAAKCMVHFEVRVLQASKPASAPPGKQSLAPAGQMDERLKQIVPRLRKLFQYSDYVPLDHHNVDVECGSARRLAVAGERWLEVTPQELQGKSVRMQVRLVKGEKQTMQANVVAGPGAPYVVGGPRHGPGELIIIIWADPITAPPAK